MNSFKVKNLFFIILSAFAIAILFVGLKNYESKLSPFDLGVTVGTLFKALLKVVVYLIIIIHLLRTLKIQNIAGLFFFLLIISIVSTSIYSATYDSSFEYGYSVGKYMKNYLGKVFTLFLILMAFEPKILKQFGNKFEP